MPGSDYTKCLSFMTCQIIAINFCRALARRLAKLQTNRMPPFTTLWDSSVVEEEGQVVVKEHVVEDIVSWSILGSMLIMSHYMLVYCFRLSISGPTLEIRQQDKILILILALLSEGPPDGFMQCSSVLKLPSHLISHTNSHIQQLGHVGRD